LSALRLRPSDLLLSAALLLSIAVSGCYTIEPPENMTPERAKEIIRRYNLDFLRGTQGNVKSEDVIATDTHFTQVYVASWEGAARFTYTTFKLQTVPYSGLGRLRAKLHWLSYVSPLVVGLWGPTVRTVEHRGRTAPCDFGIPEADMRETTFLTSFVPLWLLGVSYWYKTDAELYFEALVYMKRRALGR
jgi:hypothetical protein